MIVTGLQINISSRLDSLPKNSQDSATAEALAVVYDLKLSELEGVEPPRGFGRD